MTLQIVCAYAIGLLPVAIAYMIVACAAWYWQSYRRWFDRQKGK